jgi:hypothetical protein
MAGGGNRRDQPKASSSRSHLVTLMGWATTRLTWEVLSISVHRRLWMAAAIVTHLVTRLSRTPGHYERALAEMSSPAAL